MVKMFRTLMLALVGRLSRPFFGTRVANIPGARVIYNWMIELSWLFGRRSVVQIEGSKMYLNPHVKEPMRSAFRGYLRSPKEPLTTQKFKEVIKEGSVVVDVGANIGYFTLLGAKLCGKGGKVYSI